jgi:hypothetical protein
VKRLTLLLLFLSLSESCIAQELGRLFFTPEQRQALDQRRRARVPDRPSAPIVVSPTTRMDGYVQRRGGKSTVFVNGEPIPEHDPSAPRIDAGRATVNVGESGARAGLKPGEVLDRGTGQVRDVVGNGEIRIRRSE